MKISDRIKYYRNLLRLSQDFVAKRINVSRPAYTKMENGSPEFAANHLRILANLFKVKIEDFFKPLSVEFLNTAPMQQAQFRIPNDAFTVGYKDCTDALLQSADELFVWATDAGNVKELKGRQDRANQTYAKFNTVDAAIQYTQALVDKHLVGDAIDIVSLAMQEFGLWLSWNSFGPYSGLYLKAGTEIVEGKLLPLPIVALHSGHPSERQRFSVAHELGHHVFGQRGKIGSPTKPNPAADEKEANLFAANLLMERSRVVKVLKDMQEYYSKTFDFPSIVLLAASHLQVSYSALSRKLVAMGMVPSDQIKPVLSAKVRELELRVSKKQRPQPFQRHLIKSCEEALKKTTFFRHDKNGGPAGPQDIRFLQDYSYVEYLHSCKSMPPHDSSFVFREVAQYVEGTYPNYVADQGTTN